MGPARALVMSALMTVVFMTCCAAAEPRENDLEIGPSLNEKNEKALSLSCAAAAKNVFYVAVLSLSGYSCYRVLDAVLDQQRPYTCTVPHGRFHKTYTVETQHNYVPIEKYFPSIGPFVYVFFSCIAWACTRRPSLSFKFTHTMVSLVLGILASAQSVTSWQACAKGWYAMVLCQFLVFLVGVLFPATE